MKKIKARATDFEYSNLPKNRFQVFFDVIKNQWRKLFFLGFLILLAFLPYLLIIFFRDNYLMSINAALQKGSITQAEAYQMGCIAHLIASAASWVSFYFIALIFGGVIRVIRQLVWNDPVFLKEDLVLGIKQNFRFGAIIATFFGLICILSSLVHFMTQNVILQALPMAIFTALFVPPLLITYMEGTIYNGKFKSLFHNAVLMYIKKVPKALLFTLIIMLPTFLKYIDSFIVLKYILLIVVILFIFVLLLMMFYLFSNYLFDIYINPTYYPEMYRKGMSKEED